MKAALALLRREAMKLRQKLAWASLLWVCASILHAQTTTVRGRVEVGQEATPNAKKDAGTQGRHSAIPSTVVWLTPVEGGGVQLDPPPPAQTHARLVQKNKSFEPHLLVVPAGSMVEFPNRDPFFHNVFSLFEGKRFDLGLYEAGTTRTVRFDRPGISYIFCNIHPEMSAVIIMSTWRPSTSVRALELPR